MNFCLFRVFPIHFFFFVLFKVRSSSTLLSFVDTLQFDYGRTVCLPILIKLQKAVVEDCAKVIQLSACVLTVFFSFGFKIS